MSNPTPTPGAEPDLDPALPLDPPTSHRALGSDAPFPLEHDVTSVRAVLRSPKRLRIEVLGGLVVALALIPEAISYKAPA